MMVSNSGSISGLVVVSFIIFVLVALYVATNTYERHYYVGEGEKRQFYKALHIALPGYATIYYPEQEVDLRKWVGTKYGDLKATNKKDGTENPEATAGLALKAIGLYLDYKLKEKDDHYILYRPERTERVFTMKAFYRIWKGKKSKTK